MKYRFSSLDQMLRSPLFDFSQPYHPPARTDRCTRPARLEDMIFRDACAAEGLDPAAPLLADAFHLLFAQTHRQADSSMLPPIARTVWSGLLDHLQQDGQFAALHQLCLGNETAALAAAHIWQQEIAPAVHAMDRAAGRLLQVLERLEQRHAQAERALHQLLPQAQADPSQTPAVLRTAAEAASTAEQIRYISGKITDTLRRERRDTARIVSDAVQKAKEEAVLVCCAMRCWGQEAGGNGPQKAAHDRALLERVKGNPMLLDITRQLGRMKEMLSDLQKNDYVHGRGEKYTVSRGRDLKNLLSGELALLASPATTPLFLRKYNAMGLLQYAKRERVHKGHGDIIVCLDESASTEGENAAWGKALALAVQDICAHEGRKYALIHFSGADELRTDRFLPGQYTSDDLLSAAEHFFDSGTEFEPPIREALRLIREEAFENADILFITDGECAISDELAEQLQDAIQNAGCSVIGLLMDADSPGRTFSLERFCEKIIRLSEMNREATEQAVLAGS